ncbi:phosphatase PAP2 family protein [Gordonia paraffinivorans]|uniref:phosphatase PAP2 family protein n=1 Tax=Gordonia paraffinivorans TaxID=175628 RepID=UPI000D6189A7|nr:phosphatase PAP2 family protein [Gordonia paraffinivorans]MBY4575284.1 phosphatase PAP2 family protein [Gordonia paraffinivorans]PWD43229.1 phosphatase PAP2 family protein [Gordonia paraffinivorans]
MFISPTRIDENIWEWVVTHRTEPWNTIAEVITTFGDTVTITAITVLAVLALAAARRTADAVYVAAGTIVGFAISQALKFGFARNRPPVEDRLLNIDTFSYPSGHSMMTMIVFGLCAVVAYRSFAWVRAHRWVLLLAPLLSILVGLTRIELGVHWTTDVLSGWLFGAIWVWICTQMLLRYENRARADLPVGEADREETAGNSPHGG